MERSPNGAARELIGVSMSVQGPPEAEVDRPAGSPGTPAADLPQAPADPHYARRWLVLAVVLTAQTMILLDGTVVNVALPSAQRDLGFSNASQPWVITAYVLAFGSLLPLGGRLADVLGRKTMFMIGLVGFAAGLGRRRRRPEHRHAARRPGGSGRLRRRARARCPVTAGRDFH